MIWADADATRVYNEVEKIIDNSNIEMKSISYAGDIFWASMVSKDWNSTYKLEIRLHSNVPEFRTDIKHSVNFDGYLLMSNNNNIMLYQIENKNVAFLEDNFSSIISNWNQFPEKFNTNRCTITKGQAKELCNKENNT